MQYIRNSARNSAHLNLGKRLEFIEPVKNRAIHPSALTNKRTFTIIMFVNSRLQNFGGTRLKNKIFQSRDLCLRALDTNSLCAKSVRRNED